jgi:hypothetical protein
MNLLHVCKSLKALPVAGGVLDQDSFFIYMWQVFNNALAEREALEAQRAKTRQQQQQAAR